VLITPVWFGVEVTRSMHQSRTLRIFDFGTWRTSYDWTSGCMTHDVSLKQALFTTICSLWTALRLQTTLYSGLMNCVKQPVGP